MSNSHYHRFQHQPLFFSEPEQLVTDTNNILLDHILTLFWLVGVSWRLAVLLRIKRGNGEEDKREEHILPLILSVSYPLIEASTIFD